jgi:methionine-R-sulfoxide reductase
MFGHRLFLTLTVILTFALLLGSGTIMAADNPTFVLLDDKGQLTQPTASPLVVKNDEEWRALLAPEVYSVLRASDTEAPFCGGLLHHKGKGYFACAGCGLPLFGSTDKFDSGTGWPSFTRPVYPGNLKRIVDQSHGMSRTEIQCARCFGHLGHVFDDGPAPTGERHCLNSAAMKFVPTTP